MAPERDRLAQRLETELGAAAVSTLDGRVKACAVDGREPSLVCSAAGPEQVGAILRICAESGAAVTPRGGGTAMRFGNLPERVDVVVDLTGLNGVIDHDYANLTVTVQSGITLEALQTVVAPERQFVAFDCPWLERSTVGGIVATNLNGPRRSCYGSVRDLVTGMKVALAGGKRIRAGGKVVKNVAGYDMCKLFIGSLGSLGVVTEATLRVTPRPETTATMVVAGNLPALLDLAAAVRRSALLPAAMTISNWQPGRAGESSMSVWQLAVRADGFDEAVARQRHDIARLAESAGLSSQILAPDLQTRLWEATCDFPLEPDRMVYRVTVPQTAAGEILHSVEARLFAPLAVAITADLAAGVIWIGASCDQGAAHRFSELIDLAARHRGHAILFIAPTDLKQDVDVWGSLPPAFPLMREIKRRFDPQRLMNPGRFVGRL